MYNLAEFKTWLAEDESRKGNMPQVAHTWKVLFSNYLADDKPNYGWNAITNPSYDPYKEIFWGWVDERERELKGTPLTW